VSVIYSAVKWNRHRRIYDVVLLIGIGLYLGLFFAVGKFVWPGSPAVSNRVLLIRALGTCALLLLQMVLCIGPLARFDRRFLALLYNRRHLGVTTFCVAFAHEVLAFGYYYGFHLRSPLVFLLTSNINYGTWNAFPFPVLGLAALVILFLLAATSHDFWQKNLSPSVWKSLHMLVYLAYGLLVMHVMLGTHQADASLTYPIVLGVGAVTIISLHLSAGVRECFLDAPRSFGDSGITKETWIDVGSVDEIPNRQAKIVCLPGRERIAVFQYDGRISAVTNVCAHQRGPLGEGQIIDGCITCPWHGWEYRPQNGQAPSPFTEKIATYRVRVDGRRIFLNTEPLPPGTAVEPARFANETSTELASNLPESPLAVRGNNGRHNSRAVRHI
jgi:nitrite reductase/ring-hydroxylating ferredoxin subunit/DMSO/TMAO reductase YedYZ heme-binding membrane subunit